MKNEMFYHFLASLAWSISAIVKKAISKLKQCFPLLFRSFEKATWTLECHTSFLYQPTQFLELLSVSSKNLHLTA